MRIDAAVTRIQSTLEGLNAAARLSETSGSSAVLNLSNFYSSPPLCVGYFNITADISQRTSSAQLPLHSKEFLFDEGHAILLHRIVILSKDETLLNGSVVGRSEPPPSLCQIEAWCSDLLTIRSRLLCLTPTQSSRGDGTLWLVPPTQTVGNKVSHEVVTDRVLIQGRFERLTVCIYGWPLHADDDDRFSIAKRFITSGISNAISRPPFSPTYPDVCPDDSNHFKSQLSQLTPPEQVTSSLSTSTRTHIGKSVSHVISALKSSTFHSLLESVSANAAVAGKVDAQTQSTHPLESDRPHQLPLPPVQALQQLSCEALFYVELFEAACITDYDSESGKSLQAFRKLMFLASPTWQTFVSLLFSPLFPTASDYRFTQLFNIEHSSNPPIFNASDATPEQTTLVLRLLAGCIKASPGILDLLIDVDGLWSVTMLAGMEVNEAVIKYLGSKNELARSHLNDYEDGKKFYGSVPRVAFKVKASALQVLLAATTHKTGIEYLLSKPPSSENRNPNLTAEESQEVITPTAAEDSSSSCGLKVEGSEAIEETISIYECLILSSIGEKTTFCRSRSQPLLYTILHHVKLYLSLQTVETNIQLFHHIIKRDDDDDAFTTIEEVQDGLLHLNLQKVWASLVCLLEGLCSLVPQSQWDPTRQQESDEISNGFKTSLNSRLNRLTQVGSCHGERNDGFGPDNHYLSVENSYEEHVERLLNMTNGSSLLENLIFLSSKINHMMLVLKELDGSRTTCLSKCDSSVVMNYVASIADQSIKDVIINGRKVFDATHQRAMNEGPMLPKPSVLGFSDLLRMSLTITNEFISWILNSTQGVMNFLLNHYQHPSKNLDVAADSLITKLPVKIQNRLHVYVKAFTLINELCTSCIAVEKLEVGVETTAAAAAGSNDFINDMTLMATQQSDHTGKRTRQEMEMRAATTDNTSSSPPIIKPVLSLKYLRSVYEFVEMQSQAEAFVNLVSIDTDKAALLGQLFSALVKKQIEAERKDQDLGDPKASRGGLFDEEMSRVENGIPDTRREGQINLDEFRSSASTLGALRLICRVLWRLFNCPNSSFFISLLSPICLPSLSDLSILSKSNGFGIDGRLNKEVLLSFWGEGDPSVDAYENSDNTENVDDSRGGFGMLKCLVPSSSFTTLRQVLFRDVRFRLEVSDLLAVCTLSTSAEDAFVGTSDPQTLANNFPWGTSNEGASGGPGIGNFLTQDNQEQQINNLPLKDTLLPSHTRLIYFLSLLLESFSTSSPPFELMPISESVQIAATAATSTTTNPNPTSTSIAEKLGGFSGSQGIPTIELRDTVNRGETPIPPGRPSGWIVSVIVSLRMFLSELHSGTPTRLFSSVTSTLFSDDVAAVLKSECYDSPVLAVQEHSESLRRSFTRLILTCAASLCPSVLQVAFGGGHLNAKANAEWRESARRILPVIKLTLQSVYALLDACLPTAPYPVSPYLNTKIASHFSCSASRFSTTTGCSWVGGQLIDSSLMDGLILLVIRLSQIWISLKTAQHPTEKSDETLQHSLHKDVGICLDLCCCVLRLWGARCPDVQSTMISAVTRQARLSPSNFMMGVLIIGALGGVGCLAPAGEFSVMLSSTQPPLVAAELNGAEGKNLEAVVMRLQQQYLHKRHQESIRSGVGTGTSQTAPTTGGGGRLPALMTTLTLSARCRFPAFVEMTLYGIGTAHYLCYQIPLAPPPPAGKALTINSSTMCFSGPAGYSWVRRRLGRLTMGDDRELLSHSVFNPDGSIQQQSTPVQPPSARISTVAAATTPLAPTDVPEWASWEHLRELLQASLDEDAVETVFGSDRVTAVPLGISPATLISMTESRSVAREMMNTLSEETLVSGKQQLERLEKLKGRFRDIKIEELVEFIEMLIESSYTSNTLLHASTAHTLGILTWTHGPPVLDILLHFVYQTVRNLSTFLAKELTDDRSLGISYLFLLTRLYIFIDNVFSTFPAPTLETVVTLLRLGTISIEALQAVPVIDSTCPTYPVLKGLFDCLLPASIRLLKAGVKCFQNFIYLLSTPSQQQLNTGLSVPPASIASAAGPGMTAAALLLMKTQGSQSTSTITRNPGRFGNCLLANQFKIFLRKPGTPAVPPSNPSGSAGRPTTNPPSSTQSSLDLISGVITSIRSSLSGLSAIVNQLPVAWDITTRTTVGLDPLTSSDVDSHWAGLSLSTVNAIINFFNLITSSDLFRCISLFNIPDPFLETYLDAVYSAQQHFHQQRSSQQQQTLQTEKTAARPAGAAQTTTSSSSTSLFNIAIAGTPDPTIKLDVFVASAVEAMSYFSDLIIGKKLSPRSDNSCVEQCSIIVSDEDVLRTQMFFSMIREFVQVVSHLLSCQHLNSASLLLPVVMSQQINEKTFRTTKVQSKSNDDEAADLYEDLEATNANGEPKDVIKVDVNGVDINVKDLFLKDLLTELHRFFKLGNDTTPKNPKVNLIVKSVGLRIEEIKALRKLVMNDLTLDPPPLILRSQHLVDSELLNPLNDSVHVSTNSISLIDPFSAVGLPIRYPVLMTLGKTCGSLGGSIGISVFKMAEDLSRDSLWMSCLTLDAVPIQSNEEQRIISDLMSQKLSVVDSIPNSAKESAFLILSDVVKAYQTEQALPPSGGLLSPFFEETRQGRSQMAKASKWKISTTPQQRPFQQPSQTDPLIHDPFRSRKGPSSRAPSKHVDEFELQQQQQQQHLKAQQQQQQQSKSLQIQPPPTTQQQQPPTTQQQQQQQQQQTDQQMSSPEQALDAIPEWSEFVAHGAEKGLDVMGILRVSFINVYVTGTPPPPLLQNPQLLQDPQIEATFRCLVEAHQSIGTLFKIIELDI